LGVPADAVGCLPAPLRSGLAKKPARLPSSPPNATATATAMTWTWETMPKRSPNNRGALWRCSIEGVDAKARTKTRVGKGQNAPDKARERFGDVLLR